MTVWMLQYHTVATNTRKFSCERDEILTRWPGRMRQKAKRGGCEMEESLDDCYFSEGAAGRSISGHEKPPIAADEARRCETSIEIKYFLFFFGLTSYFFFASLSTPLNFLFKNKILLSAVVATLNTGKGSMQPRIVEHCAMNCDRETESRKFHCAMREQTFVQPLCSQCVSGNILHRMAIV